MGSDANEMVSIMTLTLC